MFSGTKNEISLLVTHHLWIFFDFQKKGKKWCKKGQIVIRKYWYLYKKIMWMKCDDCNSNSTILSNSFPLEECAKKEEYRWKNQSNCSKIVYHCRNLHITDTKKADEKLLHIFSLKNKNAMWTGKSIVIGIIKNYQHLYKKK